MSLIDKGNEIKKQKIQIMYSLVFKMTYLFHLCSGLQRLDVFPESYPLYPRSTLGNMFLQPSLNRRHLKTLIDINAVGIIVYVNRIWRPYCCAVMEFLTR